MTWLMDDLADFEQSEFTFDGKTRRIYRQGTGPAVVVIAEIPGITPDVADFARRVVDLGCTAVLPVLFGEPGAEPTNLQIAKVAAPICVSREFQAFATDATTPISLWLRALARDVHAACGGPGVGAVGMCFTGGFALGMMVEPAVLAPVLSQPSLPLGLTPWSQRKAGRSLGVSPDDLRVIKERVDDGVTVLGLRFTCDRLVPAARFERLREELGEGFVGVEIDSSPGNPWGNPKMAHSVLTRDLVDEPGHPTRDALDQVLELFRTRLLAEQQDG